MTSNTRLLIVDDESSQRALLAGFLTKNGFTIEQAASGEEAIAIYPKFFSPIALVDLKMPGMGGLELIGKLKEINPFIQIIVLTAFGSVETAVSAMRAGANDYLTKPVEDLEELTLKLSKAARQNRLIVDHQVMSERLAEVFPQSDLIGESKGIKDVKEMITLVAPKEATVLITGPSGTGKEIVTRAIHALSPRADKKLVAINCAAFPENLLESELFGHEKGAFTGAEKAKQGRFELADGGTLFLDEVGEMPLSMQVKLLRVLEERKIERLGSVEEISLDIRLITATNRDLKKEIAAGRFREDLFYRLNVIEIKLPLLSERPGDVMLLAEEFITRCSRRTGKQIVGIDSEAGEILNAYHWPGNVRELENIIERAVVLCQSDRIGAVDLSGLSQIGQQDSSLGSLRSLASVEKEHIQHCLMELDWNMTACADLLGIHRNTLRAKIKEYDLKK
ncbi:MAG: sigma-54 dependent transcriptional regulator [bacterium]|nr:sigma-54 dependent transcriptional regulator [bacterium]